MFILRTTKEFYSKVAWYTYNSYRKGLFYPHEFSKITALFNSSRDTIFEYQRQRLIKLIQHASQTTAYYRDLFKELGLELGDLTQHYSTDSIDTSTIPPLEKQIIRGQLHNLLSDIYPIQKRISNATGGSTGTPLKFYQDRTYWNQRNLSVYYFDRWAGWNFGEPQLVIWGSPADINTDSHWKQRINRYWRNQFWLDGFRLTESAMLSTFKTMQQRKPKTILAYPSSLYQFAKYISEKNLRPNWNLNGIISSAEMLYPHYRMLAESIFEAKIYDRYGSREVGLIAMECAEGRMHINSRDLFLEIDSDDSYNIPGDILITQLNNFTMPFIRYRIGDIGRLSNEICPCGNQLPVLAELLGRSTATFRAKNGTLVHGGYFTQLFYNIEGVAQFQLIQESFEKCTLKLVTNEKWTEIACKKTIEKIREKLGTDVTVDVEYVEDIPLLRSGKREFTISRLT